MLSNLQGRLPNLKAGLPQSEGLLLVLKGERTFEHPADEFANFEATVQNLRADLPNLEVIPSNLGRVLSKFESGPFKV
jgi:hypothetical protein